MREEISEERIVLIVNLARALEVARSIDAGAEARAGPEITLAASRLRDAIKAMSHDQQVILAAMASIGAGKFSPADYDSAIVAAFQHRAEVYAEAIAGRPFLADILEKGAAACRRGPATIR